MAVALQIAEILYDGLCCLTKVVHKGCDVCKLDHCERCGGCGDNLCNCLLSGCKSVGSLMEVCCKCIEKCSYLSCRECSRDTCGHCFAVDRCCCCWCDICCPANGFTNVLILDMSVMGRGVPSGGSSSGTVVVVQPQQPHPVQVAPAPQQERMEDEDFKKHSGKHDPFAHHNHHHVVHIHPAPQYEQHPFLNAAPPGGPPEGETAPTVASDGTTGATPIVATTGATPTIASDSTTLA